MSQIPDLLFNSALLTGCAALLYACGLVFVALVSVLAPSPERRRDARATLGILLRRRTR
ncbi:hypothetical protein ACIQPQ_21370 [Streptomyces sp. NPDC091281]|uniref:hypothetical protein n=1 Tax=Streptomyces sp. NPDC091281 TaxID=3365985 RepID=UPI0038154636